MTAFLWIIVVFVGIELLTHVYHITTGKPPQQTTVGERVAALLIDVGLIVWALSLLEIV